MKYTILALIILIFIPISIADIEEYDVYEIDLTTTNTYSNPYLDVRLNATFTGPTKTIVIDGFWDGGQNWKIRMAPIEAGTWSYNLSSNDAQFNGKTGTFTVAESENKGFVKVNPEYPYSFMYDDGTPFFLMGDTSWVALFQTRSEKPWAESLRMDDGTFQHYIDTRAAQGFNTIHTYAWISDSTNNVNEGGPQFNSEPWDLEDTETWDYDKSWVNPLHFQYVDERVEYMSSKEIIPGILFGDSDFNPDFTDQEQELFIRYLIARYSAYNVFWLTLGEYEEFTDEVSTVNRIGNIVEDNDPYKHVTSVHTLDTNVDLQNRGWLDYIMHQSETPDDVLRDRKYNKPVVVLEFNYEDASEMSGPHAVDPDTLRKNAWRIFIRGGYFAYGHEGIYIWYKSSYLNSLGANYMTYLYNFAITTDFWRMNPTNDIVSSGNALSIPGEEYIIHLPTGGSTTINLSQATGTLDVEWYNPRTGNYQDQTTVEGGASRTFTAPDSNDWVLYIIESSNNIIPIQTPIPKNIINKNPNISFSNELKKTTPDGIFSSYLGDINFLGIGTSYSKKSAYRMFDHENIEIPNEVTQAIKTYTLMGKHTLFEETDGNVTFNIYNASNKTGYANWSTNHSSWNDQTDTIPWPIAGGVWHDANGDYMGDVPIAQITVKNTDPIGTTYSINITSYILNTTEGGINLVLISTNEGTLYEYAWFCGPTHRDLEKIPYTTFNQKEENYPNIIENIIIDMGIQYTNISWNKNTTVTILYKVCNNDDCSDWILVDKQRN